MKFKNSANITTSIGNSLNTMINQSRIKPWDLIDTLASNRAGQFLIAPVRHSNSGSIEGPLAIACGSLQGFGGFISKEFRIHDYFLGRTNCEKFLRDHFTVPVTNSNPIFKEGYANVSDTSRFTSAMDGGLQIIPIFTPRQRDAYMPVFSNGTQWPTVEEKGIYAYRGLIKKRIQEILMNISDYSRTQKALLWIGAKVVLNGKMADAIIETIVKSLEKHKLLK